MPRVLVAYATKHGSTREVAEAIAARLRENGLDADLRRAADVEAVDDYASVVVGGSIYMGRWYGDARALLKQHKEALSKTPLFVFALGPKTLADDDVAGSRTQLDSALAKFPELSPRLVAIFGGVIDPSRLRFPLKRLPASDARDWETIARWADEVARR